MKRFIQHIIIFLLPFAAFAAGLFFIPVERNFSYSFVRGECENKASWMYHQIFENEKNADIVFTGASQTGCAIMDKLITQKLTTQTIREINVLNFGYCRRGRDIQYVMMKDLFEHKKPKILIVEISEDEPKKSHPVFPYLAGSRDLFESCVFFNLRYLSAIWKGLVMRFEFIKMKLTGEKVPGDKDLPESGYRPSSQIAPPEMLTENEKNWERRLKKQKPQWQQKLEINYSKHYLEKIVKLCRRNDCKVLFLYLPESGSKVKVPFHYDYYKTMGEIMILPEVFTRNPSNWKDATHFNDSGARETSEFIVTYLNRPDLFDSL